ncbi:MAG: hypothetical protein IKK21_12165 [Clostridia bacterium]|nr:hypothetical protein [Clostridia bacterium]
MIQVGDVMRACRNYFPTDSMHGAWTVTDGMLSPGCGAAAGEWIALRGSRRNDGVYQLNEDGSIPGASDESFSGMIYRLSPPRAFLALCEEIAAYDAARPASAVTAERFGQYSVSLSGGWESAFAARLAPWRRMFAEVIV